MEVLQFFVSSHELYLPVWSRVYYGAYGTIRAGNVTTLKSDRTFTSQKQDSTGLLYYNARYYDSTLVHGGVNNTTVIVYRMSKE
jgi:hypothetical protein